MHLGHGLVLMAIQFLVSLSPLIFSSHSSHILPAVDTQHGMQLYVNLGTNLLELHA
jgi:hypothetical protein